MFVHTGSPTMKSQTDSILFNELNGQALINLIKGHRHDLPNWVLTTDDLYDSIRHIEKRVSDPYKFKVLDSLKAGNVKFVFNEEFLSKVPRYAIFWNSIEDGKLVTYINLTFVGRRLKTTQEFSCQPHTFYTLAAFGAVVNKMAAVKFAPMINNAKILTSLTAVYSTMMVMPLRQRFGVSSDAMLAEQYQFAAAKFFIQNICEKPATASVDAMANYAAASSIIPDGTINLINHHFQFQDIKDLPDFIEKMKSFNSRTKDLTMRHFIQDYTQLYRGYSLLSIEYLPYLLLIIMDVVLLGDLSNIFRLEKLLSKTAVGAYNNIMSVL